MRPLKIVSDGPHRTIRTATLPGQTFRELRVPDGDGAEVVIDLPSDEQPVTPPAWQPATLATDCPDPDS